MTSEIKWEKNMILNKENENIGNLFDVEYKIYQYYNEKGEIKKTISKPMSKKYIKQVEKKEYDGMFQKKCWAIQKVTLGISIASLVAEKALLSVCPPAALFALGVKYIAGHISLGSAGVSLTKTGIEYLSNKEFNEQTIINELLIEEEENY